MSTLILLRHGESDWNQEKRFTGWADVDLTAAGTDQAREAGLRLREAGIEPDVAYTSLLRRAIRTLWIALDAVDRMWIPVHRDWRLNERHYGALQGEEKRRAAARMGEVELSRLRRSLRARPPAIGLDDPRHGSHSAAYRDVAPAALPVAESLEDVLERVIPYWDAAIVPALAQGKTTLVCAHTHTVRALLYQLDGHTPESIESVEIPTGTALVYRLDPRLRPVERETLSPASDSSGAA